MLFTEKKRNDGDTKSVEREEKKPYKAVTLFIYGAVA
jgi:hypothetical protein